MKDHLLFALLLAVGVSAKDMDSMGGGVYMKVMGQSGKISIGRADPPSKDPNNLVIEMDELKELDKDGNVVGKSGKPKHSFNTFASQEFSFSDLGSVSYQGVKAVNFNFSATINGAILRIMTYIFTEKGTLKNGNETTEVNNGTCKFNVEIEGWTFCNGSNCAKDENGMYLSLTITVKGKKKAEKKEEKEEEKDGDEKGKKPKGYDLGGGTEFLLSTTVNVDGKWMDMPGSYPMYLQEGGKDKFIFRFPKFANKVYYDPTMNMGTDDDDDDDDKDDSNGAANAKFSFSLLALVVASALAFIF